MKQFKFQNMKKVIVIISILIGFLYVAFSQWNPSEFIVSYWNPPILQKHADQIRRDGFSVHNFHQITPYSNLDADIAVLDAALDHGLKVVFRTNTNQLGISSESVFKTIKNQDQNYWHSITNHLAYAGFFIKDEPSLGELENWKSTIELYKLKDTNPKNFVWLNFLPVIADRTLLGCNSATTNSVECYQEYINAYTSAIDLDFLCYDFYILDKNRFNEFEQRKNYYTNSTLTH